jgi:hypothetical protein
MRGNVAGSAREEIAFVNFETSAKVRRPIVSCNRPPFAQLSAMRV